MSKLGLLVLFAFCAYSVSAQTILTGTVRDAAGRPLEGILLEAETKTQPPASAFVISGADGSFKLIIPATPASDSLRLSARALGYAEQLVRLANRSQPVALTMCDKADYDRTALTQLMASANARFASPKNTEKARLQAQKRALRKSNLPVI